MDNEIESWQEHVDFLLKALIQQAKYLDYLHEQFLLLRLNQEKMVKLLRNNNSEWKYLLRNIKPFKEEHNGMVQYLSSLSGRLTEMESLIKKRPKGTY